MVAQTAPTRLVRVQILIFLPMGSSAHTARLCVFRTVLPKTLGYHCLEKTLLYNVISHSKISVVYDYICLGSSMDRT